MSTAVTRYAEALLSLAISESAVNEYQNELSALSQIYEAESDLRVFLLSPQKDRATKKNLLIHVFRGSVRKNILHLLFLLLDKGRIEELPEICRVFSEIADKHRNILNITITTALPLDKVQIDGIGEFFKAIYHGSSVKIKVETDVSLIGGVKVSVGDNLYDGSVKGKLSKMRSAFAVK